jgi:single-stranded DNA-binding protein
MQKTIKGRIAGDITITTTTNGNQVANFRFARNMAFHNRKTGRKQKITTFFQVKAWNGVAESIERNLRVGDLVELKTDVQPNSWLQDGVVKNELVLTVRRFKFIRESRRQKYDN